MNCRAKRLARTSRARSSSQNTKVRDSTGKCPKVSTAFVSRLQTRLKSSVDGSRPASAITEPRSTIVGVSGNCRFTYSWSGSSGVFTSGVKPVSIAASLVRTTRASPSTSLKAANKSTIPLRVATGTQHFSENSGMKRLRFGSSSKKMQSSFVMSTATILSPRFSGTGRVSIAVNDSARSRALPRRFRRAYRSSTNASIVFCWCTPRVFPRASAMSCSASIRR
jgi:hypothetical protein